MKEIKLVIFDMDGLIFDTERLSIGCWVKAGAQLGWPVTPEALYPAMGRNKDDSKKVLLGTYGSDFPYEQIYDLHNEMILDDIAENGTPHRPGLLELLDFLDKQHIKKALATSRQEIMAAALLKAGGVAERFDECIYGNMVAKGKPEPDIFLEAAARLKIAPEDCLVLEDSPAGVMAAQNAGMRIAMIPDLVPFDKVENKESVLQLTSLTQVMSLF